MRKTLTKQTDSRGRVTLGRAFANKTIIIEELDYGEVRVRVGTVVPEQEARLYANESAVDSRRLGLEQARNPEFSEGPDLDAASKLDALATDRKDWRSDPVSTLLSSGESQSWIRLRPRLSASRSTLPSISSRRSPRSRNKIRGRCPFLS